MTQQSKPAAGIGAHVPVWVQVGLHVVKDLGMSAVLTAFVCWLLVVQLTGMQADSRRQNDRIATVLESNTKALNDLAGEIRQLRQERWDSRWPWPLKEKPK